MPSVTQQKQIAQHGDLTTAARVADSLARLRAYVERDDFKGYDPYDALNSPLLRVLTFGHKYPRIAAIQALKRCPVNLRPLLLIKKGYNPKGLGLFLWGYAKLYRLQSVGVAPAPQMLARNRKHEAQSTRNEERAINDQPSTLDCGLWSLDSCKLSTLDPRPSTIPSTITHHPSTSSPALEQVDRLLDMLAELKSPNCSGNAWGYNFDWQSRAFFVPKGTPTIVNSAFVGHALLDTYEWTGRQRALDLALPIKEFILKDLNRTSDNDSFCFSYTPIDRLAVHNANLLGASLLIRLYGQNDDPTVKEAALSSLRYSMKRQREDGSWWYADTDYQKWIDSFHTGFNLQSIQYFLDEDALGDWTENSGQQYREAFDRGVRFYAENFFLNDGTAKYFHDRCEPLDVHSFAQAVVFFSRMGPEFRGLVDRVVRRMIELFQDDRGYFCFQRRGHHVIKIPYMRWSQAWAFHALTSYQLSVSELDN